MISAIWPQLVLALAAGAVGGSYAVTAAVRLARGEPSSFGRSHCDACRIPLGFARTIPIASFAWSGGACAVCGARIDRIHLAGELAGVVIIGSVLASVSLSTTTAALIALGFLLLAIATVDFKCGRLPNTLTLVIAIVCASLASASEARLAAGLIAAVVCVVTMMGVRHFLRSPEGDPGLGLGDVKLLAALALWLGALTPWAIALASGGGLAVSALQRERRIRFGPMICAAAWAIGIVGEHAHG